VVREQFGVTNVVARIYDQGRAEIYERLGIQTVAPVRWGAQQVLRGLLPEGSEPLWRDASGRVRLMQIDTHDDWAGRPLRELQSAAGVPLPFLIRFGQGMVPTASTVLQDSDLVMAAVATDDVSRVESILGNPPARR